MNQISKLNMQITDSVAPLTPLQKLNLTDDFLFDVTTENLEASKIIIELSLGITIKEIAWKEGQKVIHNLPGKRGIRLDFYVEDSDGRIFNVEMQKRNEGNIPKRTRFYQGLVDAPLLKSGERGFDDLNPLYIVVICDFDLYGYGNYRYTFTNRCHEIDELELGDASTKIILNTKGKNTETVEQSLIDFLNYVSHSSFDTLTPGCDDRLFHLHDIITQIKSSEQMEVTYMKMEERDRIIREEAHETGKLEGKLETILSFIRIQTQKGTSEAALLSMVQEYFLLNEEDACQLIRRSKIS